MSIFKKTRLCELKTEFESELNITWEAEHPDPQFYREGWMSLCGEWQLFKKSKQTDFIGMITVPFAPESRISGIKQTIKRNEKFIYIKKFTLPAHFKNKRILLHFEAVDQIAEVYLNDKFLGKHIGGYTSFSFDITDKLKNENELRVCITDELDKALPYGKQRKKRGGMWYTPISGIWQPVWIEAVPEVYIEGLKITPDLNNVTIEIKGGTKEKTISIRDVGEYSFVGERITVRIDDPRHWTPEDPHLYYFAIVSGEDKVSSYFALRTVSVMMHGSHPSIALNNEPLFFHGLLDQGYFSDGIYTPASPSGYIKDILTAKKLGFNMLRKHIKLEPKLFYHYCDRFGIVVFQDMVNNRGYSFLIDTALPTIGIRKGLSRPARKKHKTIFESTSKKIMDTLYNHPSVIYYTIFNEGWGQYEADKLYRDFKAYDNTRVFDTTSGWFTTKESDVKSEHVYFKSLDIKPHPTRPLVLSEFGGYSLKIKDHSFNLDKNYGYRIIDSKDELTNALDKLYRYEVIPMIKRGLCASVLTQISDVEDETNGLMTYDRKVIKPDIDVMKSISDDLHKHYKNSCI